MSAAISLTETIPWMTAEQFAVWPGDGTGRAWQLIEGEPVPMVHASQVHALIQSELAALLRNHLRAIGSPYRVLTAAGVRPRVGAAINVRVPDLVIAAGPFDSHFVPDPVVIVEILSPSNQAETHDSVRACLSIPSLREVVIVSSVRTAAEISARDARGDWPADPTPLGPEDDLEIRTLGFRQSLASLYPG